MKYNKLIAVTNLANRLNAMLDATSRRKYKFKYEGKASPILARRGYGVLVDNRVIYFNTPVFTKLSAYLSVVESDMITWPDTLFARPVFAHIGD